MANSGMFMIITNDGKQDKLLMASEFLKNRLNAITMARARYQYADTTPTLMDIEKTHILFMNAHFKPFCAIGFEYVKVRANSGNPDFGSTIQFSIPQYGDFIYDMFVYVVINQPILSYDSGNTNPSNQPLMAWCPYPGERFFNSVKFTVNGNPMDTYYSWSYNIFRNTRVKADKLVAWDRCMGQETPNLGYVDQPNWTQSGVAPSGITSRIQTTSFSGLQTPTGQKTGQVELLIPLLFWFNLDPRLAVASVAIPYGQRFIECAINQGNLLVDLVPRGSYAGNYSSPGGSLNYSNCVQEVTLYINNIFVNKEVHDIFIKRIGFTLIRVHQYQNATVTTDAYTVLLNGIKWPVEFGWIGFQPKDYISVQDNLRRANLQNWDKYSLVTPYTATATGWVQSQRSLKVSGTALPDSSNGVLTFGTAATATFNTATGNVPASLTFSNAQANATVLSAGDEVVVPLTGFTGGTFTETSVTLHVVSASTTIVAFAETTDQVLAAIGYTGAAANLVFTIAGSTTLSVTVYSLVKTEQTSTVDTYSPTIRSIKLTAAGVTIIDDFPQSVLSKYLPFQFGQNTIVAPKDPGLMFLNFALHPGIYQPSGHFNFSRCREFQLQVFGTIFSNSFQGQFLIETSSLNFLLISDGSAVLRYTT